ncbi:MAG: pyridoxamine 5'-phosphate oxidase family protein [Flavobacteriales bacterium]|nr:pyridoxamine 5'-phosphate oxidase family protein [Flavobacteriales bacterium]
MGRVIEPYHDLKTIYRLCIGQLVRGMQKRNHPFREVAMATAGVLPNARMVILRKVEQDPFRVFIYTDYRSDKIEELTHNLKATFLFWHPSAKFQLKLMTEVTIHHKDEMALILYSQQGKHSKASYNTLKAPGAEINFQKNPGFELRKDFVPDDFAVLACEVIEMEALQLSREGHIRTRFMIKENKSYFIIP